MAIFLGTEYYYYFINLTQAQRACPPHNIKHFASEKPSVIFWSQSLPDNHTSGRFRLCKEFSISHTFRQTKMYTFILKMFIWFPPHFINLCFKPEIRFLTYLGHKNLEREGCCSTASIRMWPRKMKSQFLPTIQISDIR